MDLKRALPLTTVLAIVGCLFIGLGLFFFFRGSSIRGEGTNDCVLWTTFNMPQLILTECFETNQTDTSSFINDECKTPCYCRNDKNETTCLQLPRIEIEEFNYSILGFIFVLFGVIMLFIIFILAMWYMFKATK